MKYYDYMTISGILLLMLAYATKSEEPKQLSPPDND